MIKDLASEKKLAARAAVESFVRSGMTLGLGTGSTSDFVLEEIGTRLKDGRLNNIKGIPTSFATEMLAKKYGIEIVSLAEYPTPEVAIDGADQVLLGTLSLIKGHGGALLREKIIAAAAEKFVVVADSSKKTDFLGRNCAVPVEVLDFALGAVQLALSASGARRITLRKTRDGKVFYSDNKNPILDCVFDEISSPQSLSDTLSSIPGVLENGLFCGLTSGIFLGISDQIEYFSG
ncbi:ribose 5-phosphate isomerase A [Acetobacteraceae bacterium]|nr:ribose 5-phosphate isomerase A [Acetobacteraceae bacterium]